MKKHIAFITLFIFIGLLLGGCDRQPTKKQFKRTTFGPKIKNSERGKVTVSEDGTIIKKPKTAEPLPPVVAIGETPKKVTVQSSTTKAPFSNGGALRCSLGNQEFNDVCDYKLFYRDGVTKIFIENIAEKDEVLYRTLFFKNNRFTTKTREKITTTTTEDGNHHIVHIGNEYYKVLHRSLVEAYK
jgi:hypothetical protein